MDADYASVSRAYGFTCRGCDENCCRTKFYHHTFLEYLYIKAGFELFEPDKQVTMTGVVKEFQYTNPHSWLLVTVKNDDGTTSTWGFEAEGPSTLLRAGIKKSDFKPGTEITITGRPMRDGRTAAYWVKAVRIEDGKEFNPAAGFQVK